MGLLAAFQPPAIINSRAAALHTRASFTTAPRHQAILLQFQQEPNTGVLRFGATKGPSWWTERDGAWSPCYWVEIEATGQEILVARDDLAGLKEDDECMVELVEDGSRCRCVPLSPDAPIARRRSAAERLAARLVMPAGVIAAVTVAGLILSNNAPAPDAVFARDRCERLISGSVEAADRRAAERWLKACDASLEDPERLLDAAWLRRWGERGPPPVVRGAPVASAPPLGVPSASAVEPPAALSSRFGADGQYNFGGTRAAFAELAAALERLVPLVADGSCAEARQLLRGTPVFRSFLGYGADGSTSALVDAIPEPRRAKAQAEVAAMVQSLAAVDGACVAGASADSLDTAAERLEAVRNGLRESIALFYGESCIGSPCDRLPSEFRIGLTR